MRMREPDHQARRDGDRMALSVLMFGESGQVASEIRRLAGPSLSVTALGRRRADLADPDACAALVAATDADVVINAAAYTEVDRAEAEEDLATVINGATPGAMARAAAARGIPFLHLSTDFVFDGRSDAPLDETAPVSPLSAYGRSKLAGERAVMAANGQSVIVRTTRVYAAHGRNFVRTMLRAGAAHPLLRVVDDQYSGPTSADDLAAALLTIARAFQRGAGAPGLFHYCSAPAVSLFDFTREMFRIAAPEHPPRIAPIASEEWPTPAIRPKHPVLDCSKILSAYGIPQPDWRISLRRVLAELKEQGA